MTFKKIRTQNYHESQIEIDVYEHIETGATHYHAKYDTKNNAFCVGFKTLPQSSNGVPHILEHSVLNGSKKYPVHGVFFSMQGRNFETYSNALTGNTITKYPFSTVDETGYFNLMSVYLDSVFFPELKKDVFLQEGWRYTLDKDDNGNEKLGLSGVVFNEMIGAYSNPDSVAYTSMLKNVFANTQYENYAGGNPLEIPNLSYEEFIQFHKKYYHPSNSVFYTFGSVDAAKIHEKLETDVLSSFKKEAIDNSIDMSNLNIDSSSIYRGEHPAQKGHIIFKGYSLPEFKSVQDMYLNNILFNLMQLGKSKMSDFFLNNGLNVQVGGVHILDTAKPFAFAHFKTDEDLFYDVNDTLTEYFRFIADNGFDKQELDNFFDYLELQIKEGEASGENLGISFISNMANTLKYNFNMPEQTYDLAILNNVRNLLENKEFLHSYIIKNFIKNEKTFVYISDANPEYSNNLKNQIDDLISQKEQSLTESEKNEIKKQSHDLETVRLAPRDVSILPTLKLKDITINHFPEEHPVIEKINNSEIFHYDADTGIEYFKLFYPVDSQNIQKIFFIKLAAHLISTLNLKGKTVEETNLWKQQFGSEIDIHLSISPKVNQDFDLSLSIHSKSLDKHSSGMIDKIKKYQTEIDFDNKELIISMIHKIWQKHVSGFINEAHHLTIVESQSNLSKIEKITQTLTLDYKNNFIKNIVQSIKDNDFTFIEELKNTYSQLFSYNPKIFIYGKNKHLIEDSFTSSKLNFAKNNSEHTNSFNKQVLLMDMPTSHVAISYAAPEGNQKEAVALSALSSYLKNYLLQNIREKNGAYGANASYSQLGNFTFYSYRDPSPQKTIEFFKQVGNHIYNQPINEEQLDVAKISLLKEFNKPSERIGRATFNFNRLNGGLGMEKEEFCKHVMELTAEDLKTVIFKYLLNSDCAITVSTDLKTQQSMFSDWNVKNVMPISSSKEHTVKPS